MSNWRHRHPADNGRALLSAWVEAPLRDYARSAAKAKGIEFSAWVERAIRSALTQESLERALLATGKRIKP